MRFTHSFIIGGLCLLPVCTGCNSGAKETAKVVGVVTVDGKPINFGRVQFSPVSTGDAMDAGKAGYGYINPDGTFSLTTYKENDGAVVGQHRVLISSRTKPVPDGEEKPIRDERIPPFENLRLVGQTFEVSPGQDNNFEIKLTSEQIRNFGEHE